MVKISASLVVVALLQGAISSPLLQVPSADAVASAQLLAATQDGLIGGLLGGLPIVGPILSGLLGPGGLLGGLLGSLPIVGNLLRDDVDDAFENIDNMSERDEELTDAGILGLGFLGLRDVDPTVSTPVSDTDSSKTSVIEARAQELIDAHKRLRHQKKKTHSGFLSRDIDPIVSAPVSDTDSSKTSLVEARAQELIDAGILDGLLGGGGGGGLGGLLGGSGGAGGGLLGGLPIVGPLLQGLLGPLLGGSARTITVAV